MTQLLGCYSNALRTIADRRKPNQASLSHAPAAPIAGCLDDMRDFADAPSFDDLTLLAIQRRR